MFKNAKWVGSETMIIDRHCGYNSPTLRFRKSIGFNIKPKKATIYISGLGCFVLYVNGNRIGDEYLSPAFTDYRKRILYCEYDVAEYLVDGENIIGVEIGGGFFNQPAKDTWGFWQAGWRDNEKLLFSMICDDKCVCVSDSSWKISRVYSEKINWFDYVGPCYNATLRIGEFYDARREDGWLSADFDHKDWIYAKVKNPPGGIMEKQVMPPIRICEQLKPIAKYKSENGVVFDFGRSISGVCRFKTKAPEGTQLKMQYSEYFIDNKIDISAISPYVESDEFSVDKYIFKGAEVEEWNASFVYHGFRYVEVTGVDLVEDEITALYIHTDVKEKSTFSSSDESLNWFVSCARASVLGNLHGLPEDCPHREKNGWTDDAGMSCDHATFRYDMVEFYKKWLKDICDTQLLSGQISGIAPTCGWGYTWGAGPLSDCAMFFIPQILYTETGDDGGFDIIYECAKKYFEYTKYYIENDLVCYGLADWCPPSIPNMKSMNNELSDSCYYHRMLTIFGQACLRRQDADGNNYLLLAEKVKKAINEKYVKEGSVDNDSMATLATVLYFDVVEGENAQKIADKLAEVIVESDYRLLCGIIGVKTIFRTLTRYGHGDIAYKLFKQKEYPSFGYWKEQGATTLWESFEGKISRFHHMFSSPMDWIYRDVAGIQNLGIAYDKCLLKPLIYADDCSVSCSTETPKGLLSFDWKYCNKQFVAQIIIPKGCDCTLKVYNVERKLTEGTNSIRIAF